MPPIPEEPKNDTGQDFTEEANRASHGLLREIWDFLKHEKKWYLTPVILALLLLGFLVFLGSTGAAPFIYTLF